jgi:hypothetical protein
VVTGGGSEKSKVVRKGITFCQLFEAHGHENSHTDIFRRGVPGVNLSFYSTQRGFSDGHYYRATGLRLANGRALRGRVD